LPRRERNTAKNNNDSFNPNQYSSNPLNNPSNINSNNNTDSDNNHGGNSNNEDDGGGSGGPRSDNNK
jgi:hypothetical protein